MGCRRAIGGGRGAFIWGGGHNSRCFFCLQVDGLITGGTGGSLVYGIRSPN